MLTLKKFEDLQARIKRGVEGVERLKVLRDKLVDFQELIFSPEIRDALGYDANESIDQLQAPLENLTCEVESAIKETREIVDDDYSQLRDEVFSISTRGDLTGDYSYLDAE